MKNIAIDNLNASTQVPSDSVAFPVPKVREPELLKSYDEPDLSTRWLYLNAEAPIKVTDEVLSSLHDKRTTLEAEIKSDLSSGRDQRVRFMVLAAERPGVFSFGGDLGLFKEKILTGDREGLKKYARTCIDLVYDTVTGMRLPLTTIALVRGTALGGGFEYALAHNVVVAERQSQMGLPEIMFNMFPGMGAYQLLCRRLPPAKAEELILSGRTYPAEELYEMGLIDILADEGTGEEAVREYIRQARSKTNGREALRRVVRETDPIKYEDLAKSIDVWVDAAFNLSETDLQTMDFLLRAQQRMMH